MNRAITITALLAAACPLLPAQARTLAVASPDGTVKATLSDDGGHLRYTVRMDDRAILAPSALGIRADGMSFGDGVALGTVVFGKIDRQYHFFGAHNGAIERLRTATITATSSGQRFTIDLRVANDGVGVRLRLPAKPGRHVEAEGSSWRLAATQPRLWATHYSPGYEELYRTTTGTGLAGEPLGLPLTAQINDRWVVISDAAQVDYGDVAITKAADGSFAASLIADPKGWSTDREVIQPWRVTIVARDLTGLVNTTLVQNLNPPASPALAAASWIRPGLSSWQWLSSGAPVESEQHQWVDWTHQLGFPYYLIDEDWSEWKRPWETLAETIRYAADQKVAIWVWVHSKLTIDAAARRALLRRLAGVGVVGVKVDFPAAADRDWSNWYVDFARDAAAEKLMVDFHGATKPTGIERTWPNILTREGVRGHEWHITRYNRVLPPDHDTILPFSRYVVGPGDYTPTVFAPKELQGNSWSRELAQMIIFTSPFLSIGGHPQQLLDNPARDIVKAVPATWDETRVLPQSDPGQRAIFARRTGKDWFVAAINGSAPAKVDLALDFLKRQSCTAILFHDASRPDAYRIEHMSVTAGTHIPVTMRTGGGFVARLTDCHAREGTAN